MSVSAMTVVLVGLASFPGSSPAFDHILYKQQGDSLEDLIMCAMTYYATKAGEEPGNQASWNPNS